MYDDLLGPKEENKIKIYYPYIPLQITKIKIEPKSRKLKEEWFFDSNGLLTNEKEILKDMNKC